MHEQNSIIKRKNLSKLESTEYNLESLISERGSYFSQLGIVLTEKCNIKCRHCIFSCLPSQKMELGWSVIERLIKEAAALGNIKNISFTGGEPFLELDTLVNAVRLCKRLGLKASVVTNGFWATSLNEAKSTLEKLDGLILLNVSTDTFHQEFVPIDRIHNTILSCNELGIDCYIRVCYLNDPVSEIESIKKQLSKVEGLYKISSQPVVPSGRAASQIDIDSIYSYDPIGVFCISVNKPLIISNGDVAACCGPVVSWLGDHPLKLGNIHNQSLEEIRNAADLNPIVQVLRLWGPGELVQLVQKEADEKGYSFTPPLRDDIQDLCSLCKYIVADPNHVKMLRCAVENSEIWHEIAVGRLLEFGEISMFLEEKELD